MVAAVSRLLAFTLAFGLLFLRLESSLEQLGDGRLSLHLLFVIRLYSMRNVYLCVCQIKEH